MAIITIDIGNSSIDLSFLSSSPSLAIVLASPLGRYGRRPLHLSQVPCPFGDEASHPPQTLTERWNGVTWNIVSRSGAHGASASNALAGVAASATNDVWVVGDDEDLTTNIQQTLNEGAFVMCVKRASGDGHRRRRWVRLSVAAPMSL